MHGPGHSASSFKCNFVIFMILLKCLKSMHISLSSARPDAQPSS